MALLPTAARQSITLTYRVKRFFFDRAEVTSKLHRQTVAVLKHAGAFTRKVARNSMRRRKGSSAPGQPPHAHSTNDVDTLKNILFAYDGRFSVIVGPVGLNQYSRREGQLEQGGVPNIQEFGGEFGHHEKFMPFDYAGAIRAFGPVDGPEFVRQFGTIDEAAARRIYKDSFQYRVDRRLGGTWIPVGRKRLNRKLTRFRKANYPARPFMGPALAKAADKFPELYARRFVA